ncbi:MAG: GAF domain-containing protein, partial [Chloroflexota bacterium]|nr:GAF domain-containing protein [Chloroflexota bacterium]
RDISQRKTLERERDAMYEHRVFQIQLVTGLAQEIGAAPTLDGLYQRVVTLVKERLGYYHAQIFHHIPELSAVVLVKSYARTGEEVGGAGHRLPYGKGIVGTAAITGKSILAPDVSQNSYWMHHPNFPNTQGELAVPMKLRNRVLGVLDVLSDTAGTLTREDEIVLLDLASRVASIIGSSHMLEEADVLRQFAQASDGIGWLALEDSTITYANSALCNIIGAAQPEDLVGKPIISCYPEYLRERVRDEILPTAMREGQWSGELALLSTESIITPIVQSIFLAHDEIGNPLHLVTVVTDITAQKRAETLLDSRSQQMNCLNDIDRKIEERPQIIEFLHWLADHIPSVMRRPDVCAVAIEFEGRIYGADSAVRAPRQIVEDIHIGGEVAGRVYVSYTQERDFTFTNEEKALLGDIARRVSDYVENRRMSEQAQATLEEVKASHKLYLPAQWVERAPAQKPPESPTPPITTPVSESRLKACLRKVWQRLRK